MKQAIKLKIGGIFSFKHYRDGVLIDQGENDNIFIDEGLIYALNVGFGAPVGGAPTVISNFYNGLATANRTWLGSETAAGIHTLAAETEAYASATRPEWSPQALASSGNILLTDTGFETTYNINANVTVYGAFMINASAKDGSSDATAVLVAGSNFTSPRLLEDGDVFKVGYSLSAQSGA